jgi:hypothetical protein
MKPEPDYTKPYDEDNGCYPPKEQSASEDCRAPDCSARFDTVAALMQHIEEMNEQAGETILEMARRLGRERDEAWKSLTEIKKIADGEYPDSVSAAQTLAQISLLCEPNATAQTPPDSSTQDHE